MRYLLIICLFVLAGHCVDSAPKTSKGSCEPGTYWKDDCNSCSCSSNGVAMCTLMECLGSATSLTRNLPRGKECLPGSSWKSQCNSCTCTDDGMPLCTLEFCYGYENELVKTCAPNTLWNNDCNTCRCLSAGQAACTKKECL